MAQKLDVLIAGLRVQHDNLYYHSEEGKSLMNTMRETYRILNIRITESQFQHIYGKYVDDSFERSLIQMKEHFNIVVEAGLYER